MIGSWLVDRRDYSRAVHLAQSAGAVGLRNKSEAAKGQRAAWKSEKEGQRTEGRVDRILDDRRRGNGHGQEQQVYEQERNK